MLSKEKRAVLKRGRKAIDRTNNHNYHIWLTDSQRDFIDRFRAENAFLRTRTSVISYAIETLRKATENRQQA
jgi:hypothetical protein